MITRRAFIGCMAAAPLCLAGLASCAKDPSDNSKTIANGEEPLDDGAKPDSNTNRTSSEEGGASKSAEDEEAPTSPADGAGSTSSAGSASQPKEGTSMILDVNGKQFTATFANTAAASELRGMLPLTLGMSDLHHNEKYAYLNRSLTSGNDKPARMEPGQVMLYGDDCLVVFYEGFANSYGGYAQIATLDDPTGLASTLGSGSVTITFREG